jgi:hypothetical protein
MKSQIVSVGDNGSIELPKELTENLKNFHQILVSWNEDMIIINPLNSLQDK